ncbi:TauD/TfdA family dioxygenase [Nocardiopsis rhodophaea]|uniref:TauD/TfdA family dioxygenase n=1 Tax=Nocardiopsis rhodophaea TaxID=280238 RepID=UPI0031DADE9A
MTPVTAPLDLGREPGRVLAQIRETGIAGFLAQPDRGAFAHLAASVLRPYAHPDAGPDGITELRPVLADAQTGQCGFTRAGLQPHTERAGAAVPPHLLMLLCCAPADSGGETVLVDGHVVFARLAEHAPDALAELTRRGAAYFGGATGYGGPVFEQTPAGRWSLRLRLDALARFSPRVEPHLPVLLDAIDDAATEVRLCAGQGLLVDNTRWLHGRRGYAGQRVMLRALGEPVVPLSRGFYASWAIPSA